MTLVIQYTHVHGFRPALLLRFQTNTRAPMIDSAGRKVVAWSERKYEVYEFYRRRQRDSRLPGRSTTQFMPRRNSARALSMICNEYSISHLFLLLVSTFLRGPVVGDREPSPLSLTPRQPYVLNSLSMDK